MLMGNALVTRDAAAELLAANSSLLLCAPRRAPRGPQRSSAMIGLSFCNSTCVWCSLWETVRRSRRTAVLLPPCRCARSSADGGGGRGRPPPGRRPLLLRRANCYCFGGDIVD